MAQLFFELTPRPAKRFSGLSFRLQFIGRAAYVACMGFIEFEVP